MDEKDLLSAPEADYMNDEQLAYFKALLLKKRAVLIEILNSGPSSFSETENSADPVDRASLEEERQSELAARGRDGKMLVEIDEALNCIANGEYGYCMDSGEPIGLKRLLVQPATQLSVEAKERRERLSRQYGLAA